MLSINNNMIKCLFDFEDVLITDNKGVIVFYDLSNFSFFDLNPDEIVGKKVTSLYRNLENKDSTIMKVIKSKEPICDYKQELVTMKHNKVTQISSTFPILENEKVLGTIEFSKCVYTKDSLANIKFHSDHKIYRKNHTIYTIDDIITKNNKMINIKNKLRKIAQTDSSVFIYGETGTGKELIAQSIHNLSKRCSNSFISQNCAAIPENLIESILFGTEEGSFTGATNKKGLFEIANGGTLFLDEINSLSPFMQTKLLKAVEEKRIRRIGGSKLIYMDIKIIVATNENPEILMSNGRLRSDFFYRLGVVQINLPPLRDRKEDIKVLIDYYLNYYNKRMDMKITKLSSSVKSLCYNYYWPGNIRQLKNMIEGAYNSVSTDTIELSDIPDWIRLNQENNKQDTKEKYKSLRESIEKYEQELIQDALIESNYSVSKSAKLLKLSRQTMWNKINKYNVYSKKI